MAAGTNPANMAVVGGTKTAAAVNSEMLPTGEMARNVYFQSDQAGMQVFIKGAMREGGFTAVPALSIAERLFGNYILSNMIIVGAAYQSGFLPIAAEAIEDTITTPCPALADQGPESRDWIMIPPRDGTARQDARLARHGV